MIFSPQVAWSCLFLLRLELRKSEFFGLLALPRNSLPILVSRLARRLDRSTEGDEDRGVAQESGSGIGAVVAAPFDGMPGIRGAAAAAAVRPVSRSVRLHTT